MRSSFSRARARIPGRYAVACALILATGVPAGAVAAGEGRFIVAGKRNPDGGALQRETQIIADNSRYGTRQSNKGSGGGAIYGCRSRAGDEPCVRANNLEGGRAFEFETDGNQGGAIVVEDSAGVPFVTNAKGRVENLNADRLDDKEAADFAAAADLLFAVVSDGGTLAAGRGATQSARTGDATTVTFNRDVSRCSFTATANGTDPQPLAVRAVAGQPAQVVVTEPSETPGAPVAFHLQVVC